MIDFDEVNFSERRPEGVIISFNARCRKTPEVACSFCRIT